MPTAYILEHMIPFLDFLQNVISVSIMCQSIDTQGKHICALFSVLLISWLPWHGGCFMYSDNSILPIPSVDPPRKKLTLLLRFLWWFPINSSSKLFLIIAAAQPGPISYNETTMICCMSFWIMILNNNNSSEKGHKILNNSLLLPRIAYYIWLRKNSWLIGLN